MAQINKNIENNKNDNSSRAKNKKKLLMNEVVKGTRIQKQSYEFMNSMSELLTIKSPHKSQGTQIEQTEQSDTAKCIESEYDENEAK